MFVLTLYTGFLAIDVKLRFCPGPSQSGVSIFAAYFGTGRVPWVFMKRMRRLILPEAENFSKPSMYVLAIAS